MEFAASFLSSCVSEPQIQLNSAARALGFAERWRDFLPGVSW